MDNFWHSLNLNSARAGFKPRLRRPVVTKYVVYLAWISLVVSLFSFPFIKETDIWTYFSTIAAATACLLALASVGYTLTSFVAIVALTHFVFYPLAAWGNLMLPVPAVRLDLWVDTQLAMWGCTVGVLALALGAKVANLLNKRRVSATIQMFSNLTTLKSNILLASLSIFPVLLMVALGIYYHSAVADFNLDNTWSLNLIFMLLKISYCGLFLQVFRYTRTHASRDAWWATILCLLPICLFLPSGSREWTIGFLPLLMLAFSEWETNLRRKIWTWSGVILIIIILIPGIEFYRGEKGVGKLSWEGKFQTALQATTSQGKGLDDSFQTTIRRLSDYVATGRIISDTPEVINYRGTEGMEDWWQIFVPGFLNIISHRIDLTEGIVIGDLYGITHTRDRAGSAPAMIIGDLFSRWGWPGIILGLMTLGFILRQLDLRIFNYWNTFKVIFFVMFGDFVVKMVSSTLLNIFVALFRDLAVLAFISYLLARMITPKSLPARLNDKVKYHFGPTPINTTGDWPLTPPIS
jgi:hypothetical protein